MCGISGIIAFNEVGRLYAINLTQANNQMAHRGPDAAGIFNDYYVGLGHRRLSIIDLSSVANQPMHDPSGRYTIVFNGEIYNFMSLRERLQAQGVEFRTQGDTEVLLQMYIHHGKACLNQLHGFFSFAIYDKEEQSVFIARDRFGLKPLVYYQDEDKLLFASEIKALLAFNIPREVDYTSLLQYFQLTYIPAPATAFKNIYKLEPGHCMLVKAHQVQVERYYRFEHREPATAPLSYEQAQVRLRELLDASVQERMVSDVPLGAFLSGGIDSSTVVAFASRYTDKLNTFSIGFKDAGMFDETHYAQLVAKKYNTEHTVFQMGNDDIYGSILEMLDFYGEPFADASAIPTYVLCAQTRNKVTVALSGDGADEVFAGYNKYWGELRIRQGDALAKMVQQAKPLLDLLPKSRHGRLANKVRQLHRLAYSMELSAQERYWFLSSWRSEAQAREMFTEATLKKIDEQAYQQRKQGLLAPITGGPGLNDMLYADVKMVLPDDMLHKVDSMSMAKALEVRVPFLDYRLVEFAFGLPTDYKINGQMKKRLLQDAVRELLPPELYKRPKQGFEVPLAQGYKRELRSWIEELLDENFIREQGFFSIAYIRELKQAVFHSDNFDQNQVWSILAFQHWWKKIIS